MLHLVDATGWLEFLGDGPGADFFQVPLEAIEYVVVPVILIYETYRFVARTRGELAANEAINVMEKGRIVPLDALLAREAAVISAQFQLAMADSMIYATARRHDALLWTQRAAFAKLPHVRYQPKKEH